MIQVKTFYAHNDLRNFSYLIFDDQSSESWIIDPYEASGMINHIKKNHLQLRGIFNTHQHFDHIRGNSALVEAFAVKVWQLSCGETVQLSQSHELETLDTPGHTPDHQVFFLTKNKKKEALFSGDTLFNAGVGNCKNGGDISDLYRTTMRLRELEEDVTLYPGHDYLKRNLEFAQTLEPENQEIQACLKEASFEDAENRRPRSLGEELKVNPFFRLDSQEIRQILKSNTNSLEHEDSLERDLFTKIRSLRDKW